MVLEIPRVQELSNRSTRQSIERWRGQLKEEIKPIERHSVLKNFSLLYGSAQQIAIAHWNLGKTGEAAKWQPEQIKLIGVYYQKLTGREGGDGDFRSARSEALLVISTPRERPKKGKKRIVLSSLYVPETNDHKNLVLPEVFKDRSFWWDRVSLGIPGIKGRKRIKAVEVDRASLKGNRRSLRRLRVYETDEVYTRQYGFLEATLAKVIDMRLVEDFLKAQKIIDSKVRKVDYPYTEEFEVHEQEDYQHLFVIAGNLLRDLPDRLNYYKKRAKKLAYVNRAVSLMRKADLGSLVVVK